jgi:hypothetical protein
VVSTACSGSPSSSTLFSISDPVGHACTQAPQETHSDVRNGSSALATIRESKPRPRTVSANVPCISAQARTQREQTMHFAGSYWKYGLDSSTSSARWFAPLRP